ncbi:unnamed protein product [Auanema sp. JU1783]|nr:unnamed protein product [Auanema sp. JU1783]
MDRCLLVFIICSSISPSFHQALKVCDYLKMIGRTSSDCSLENDSDNSTLSPLASIISSIEKDENRRQLSLNKIQQRPERFFNFEVCMGPEYNDCRFEKMCSSKYSCLKSGTGTRCCLKPSTNHIQPKQVYKCPSTIEMGYVCLPWRLKLKTTSWCYTNNDCAKTSPQLCCDTGCGFNVCLQMNGLIVDNGK